MINLHLQENRSTSQLQTVGTGTVTMQLTVITKGFQKLGSGTSVAIEVRGKGLAGLRVEGFNFRFRG